jgi:hypothetical protein
MTEYAVLDDESTFPALDAEHFDAGAGALECAGRIEMP